MGVGVWGSRGVGESVGVGVWVAVAVDVIVGVRVAVGLGVRVGVGLGVDVGVAVGVAVAGGRVDVAVGTDGSGVDVGACPWDGWLSGGALAVTLPSISR